MISPASLKLFDLHCDTLFETVRQNKGLFENDLSISFTRLAEYSRFTQVLAVWSDYRVSEDSAYRAFFAARDKLERELSRNVTACDVSHVGEPNANRYDGARQVDARQVDARHMKVRLCTSESELATCEREGINSVFLAVEGGKLLSDDISRLDALYKAGVRFLTLVWNKTCKIGGAHDTDEGLTDFGRTVVRRCFELGIIPDVSHASAKMCDEVIELADGYGKACIATHSNSYSVRAHRRNLTDERFAKIARLGGVVGISLEPTHLTDREECTVDDVVSHIEHYLSLGGEDTVCLGCDLDGVSKMPFGIKNVSDVAKIAEKLSQINYTEALINKIFYANARNFISLWLN